MTSLIANAPTLLMVLTAIFAWLLSRRGPRVAGVCLMILGIDMALYWGSLSLSLHGDLWMTLLATASAIAMCMGVAAIIGWDMQSMERIRGASVPGPSSNDRVATCTIEECPTRDRGLCLLRHQRGGGTNMEAVAESVDLVGSSVSSVWP